VADEIDSKTLPGTDNSSNDADRADAGVRQAWSRIPAGPRLVIPIALLLTTVVVGFYAWMKPARDDWSQLPGRLVCQAQSGNTPPPSLTVASVAVTHPRANVLQLVVRFTQPLPPSPSMDPATASWVGYTLTYSLVNNGTAFADLGPQQGTDDLAIVRSKKAPTSKQDVRSDKADHAGRTAPDTVEISLDLTKFGIENALVSPQLTVLSQLNTPPSAPVMYATQICHG
jgi:hypothetical protein